jgi:molecular chaperone DnaJ
MATNYYLVLGVTAEASGDEIKAAFGRRASDLRPNRSGLASGPFQEAQQAYSVLSDPERRRRYDQQYRTVAAGGRRSGPVPEPLMGERRKGESLRPVEPARGFREVSLLESFETYRPSFDELFGRFWGNFEPFGRPKAEQLESLTAEVVVSPEEARYGGRVRVLLPARAACGTCGGHGAVGPYECWRCEGHGAVTTEYPVEVEYPPGIPDGYALRIPLARFGIQNFYLTVLFRVSEGWD